MDIGLYVAASGALRKMEWMDTHTNNIANTNVPGFKKDFHIYEVHEGKAQESVLNAGGGLPGNAFPKTVGVFTDFSQGQLKETRSPNDLALSGHGFFAVDTGNGIRYTRKGDFIINSDNELITKQGYPVMGEAGVIKLTSTDFMIDKEGIVTEAGKEIGTLKVVTFDRPFQLKKMGEGLYMPSAPQLDEIEATDVTVLQGYLEISNASVVEEMVAMITALRSYETHMKVIKGFDEIADKVIGLNRT